jgi:N-acetylglucosaminyldiphosphoundecaprenol N-acetyl-beta-D-mannosaminyltransferase
VQKVQVAAAEPGFCGYVTVTGVHGVMESQRDQELKRIHNRSFLTTPDGMPMVWLSRWSGYEYCRRVYGPELMLEVFRQSEAAGQGHYLFGGGDGVAEKLRGRLRDKFPETRVVGTNTPPFRPLSADEEQAFVNDLHEKKPHFLWVGLSTPKQEKFMAGLLRKHPDLTSDWGHGLVMFGVGAAFDLNAGVLRQAPRWVRHCGLEWLFRLGMEPRRLWRRYALNNPAFVCRIIAQMMGRTEYPLEK